MANCGTCGNRVCDCVLAAVANVYVVTGSGSAPSPYMARFAGYPNPVPQYFGKEAAVTYLAGVRSQIQYNTLNDGALADFFVIPTTGLYFISLIAPAQSVIGARNLVEITVNSITVSSVRRETAGGQARMFLSLERFRFCTLGDTVETFITPSDNVGLTSNGRMGFFTVRWVGI